MVQEGGSLVTMTVIWTGMVVLSILCGLAAGRGPEVAAAAVEGAAAAVELEQQYSGERRKTMEATSN